MEDNITRRTHPALRAKPVDGPEPCTPLESALNKLQDTDSKMTHLEPRERDALFMLFMAYVHQRNKATILAHMLLELAPEELEGIDNG